MVLGAALYICDHLVLMCVYKVKDKYRAHGQLKSVNIGYVKLNKRSEKTFTLDNQEYDIDQLSVEAREIYNRLGFVRIRLHDMKNNMALLQKAKNAYINDIKREGLKAKTGIDLSEIFEDD